MKKYTEFINEEVGLRNIKSITKGHKECEIYFHKDLDGVTSALAMSVFLKNYYQIETVDCHIIQYGGLEYAIKHHQPENLCVLVDFLSKFIKSTHPIVIFRAFYNCNLCRIDFFSVAQLDRNIIHISCICNRINDN